MVSREEPSPGRILPINQSRGKLSRCSLSRTRSSSAPEPPRRPWQLVVAALLLSHVVDSEQSSALPDLPPQPLADLTVHSWVWGRNSGAKVGQLTRGPLGIRERNSAECYTAINLESPVMLGLSSWPLETACHTTESKTGLDRFHFSFFVLRHF